MKGYFVTEGYMGFVENRYMLFASEADYREYYLENRQTGFLFLSKIFPPLPIFVPVFCQLLLTNTRYRLQKAKRIKYTDMGNERRQDCAQDKTAKGDCHENDSGSRDYKDDPGDVH